ncbi:leucine-rich repeat-containing protein 69 [Chanos chanos]|uniref:Leucine-rich repeat-containing protein 69 n=1 Tax=Chanos chanos TaxID=29144 RepID=A0A6J2WL50_CHACN|nr:leucine-rich repeat-containing protein 69 [Chanos chanos]
MEKNLVIRALKANAKSFSLSCKKISYVPKSIARLTCILTLQLNNNCLSSLPLELKSLHQLTELHLGNNAFEELPVVLKHLNSLRKLYLFRNKITTLPSEVLDGLPNLVLLNLNHNKIRVIPPAIKSLVCLETISVTDNQLQELPAELGSLRKLTEINFTNNKLTRVPQQLCNLSKLTELYLARNNLTELPEGVLGWTSLRVLDIAGNNLSMFPVDFQQLPLEELLCEGNEFVQCELLESKQEREVLSLKEHAARIVLKEDMNKFSVVARSLPLYPELAHMLSHRGKCALCFQPFLTTWLECVQFINLKKDMGMKKNLTVPVRALLCSYSCFNKRGHSFYGLVKLHTE